MFVFLICGVLEGTGSPCWAKIVLFHFIYIWTLHTEISVEHTPQFMIQYNLWSIQGPLSLRCEIQDVFKRTTKLD